MKKTVAGIFVGGRASRMGGIAKGRLPSSVTTGEPIIERSMRTLREAGVSSCVLVGREPSPSSSSSITTTIVEDDPEATGPLAGLLALLTHANSENADYALAIACDMPFIDAQLVGKLIAEPSSAMILAPRDNEGRWQPFFARYEPKLVVPLARAFANQGGRRLQDLFARAHAAAFDLDSAEEEKTLTDWDTIDDLPPELRGGKTDPSS